VVLAGAERQGETMFQKGHGRIRSRPFPEVPCLSADSSENNRRFPSVNAPSLDACSERERARFHPRNVCLRVKQVWD